MCRAFKCFRKSHDARREADMKYFEETHPDKGIVIVRMRYRPKRGGVTRKNVLCATTLLKRPILFLRDARNTDEFLLRVPSRRRVTLNVAFYPDNKLALLTICRTCYSPAERTRYVMLSQLNTCIKLSVTTLFIDRVQPPEI